MGREMGKVACSFKPPNHCTILCFLQLRTNNSSSLVSPIFSLLPVSSTSPGCFSSQKTRPQTKKVPHHLGDQGTGPGSLPACTLIPYLFRKPAICQREVLDWDWEMTFDIRDGILGRQWSLFVIILFMLGQEKTMAPHSSTLAWKISWTEEPGALHGVVKSRTQLSNFTFTFHFHALEKEMATHSSGLAWRIPGMASVWWAAVYGVAQSRTRLKRLSSSNSRATFTFTFLSGFLTEH